MNDSLLSLTLILAELGAVLLLVMLALVIWFVLSSKKEVKTTHGLIRHIKSMIPGHRSQLVDYFKDKLEDNKIDFNIETLMGDERKIYDRLIKVSITKDTNLLKPTTDDINTLINNYVRLLALTAEKTSSTDAEKESHVINLRKENEALRLELASVEKRLILSNETIENMMGEFSSMYEGGKKEGEQRLKNEMYQLKQSLDAEDLKVKSKLTNLDENAEDS